MITVFSGSGIAPQWDCLGMITIDGHWEHYGPEEAKRANYHHSNVVKDRDAYGCDSTLRYAIVGGVLQLNGNAALDAYEKGAGQIAALIDRLSWLPGETRVETADHHIQRSTNNCKIGTVSSWRAYRPRNIQPQTSPKANVIHKA
jgi:hypothetical protein